MRRKVIQIAGSTQLVSLPRQWAKKHNIQKGQEIEVHEEGNRVIITSSTEPIIDVAELDISDLGDMTARCIHALYKRGADELKITFREPSYIRKVQDAIGKESVGFEILEQKDNHCTIKYVSGNLEEFDSILRRTFLLLLNMADQTYENLKDEKFDALQTTAFLEEANNRFTTICRRYLNKTNNDFQGKVGPMYYIVEELEKVADQYKCLCQHFSKLKGKNVVLDNHAMNMFGSANDMLRDYYELFYKFDANRLRKMKQQRNKTVDEAHKLLQKDLNYGSHWLVYHTLVITDKLFAMTGSLLLLKL